jgi:hypothetical protein
MEQEDKGSLALRWSHRSAHEGEAVIDGVPVRRSRARGGDGWKGSFYSGVWYIEALYADVESQSCCSKEVGLRIHVARDSVPDHLTDPVAREVAAACRKITDASGLPKNSLLHPWADSVYQPHDIDRQTGLTRQEAGEIIEEMSHSLAWIALPHAGREASGRFVVAAEELLGKMAYREPEAWTRPDLPMPAARRADLRRMLAATTGRIAEAGFRDDERDGPAAWTLLPGGTVHDGRHVVAHVTGFQLGLFEDTESPGHLSGEEMQANGRLIACARQELSDALDTCDRLERDAAASEAEAIRARQERDQASRERDEARAETEQGRAQGRQQALDRLWREIRPFLHDRKIEDLEPWPKQGEGEPDGKYARRLANAHASYRTAVHLAAVIEDLGDTVYPPGPSAREGVPPDADPAPEEGKETP